MTIEVSDQEAEVVCCMRTVSSYGREQIVCVAQALRHAEALFFKEGRRMFLFGKKKNTPRRNEVRANCPMCSVNLTIDIDPSIEHMDYPFFPGWKQIGEGNCPFCKTAIAVVLDENNQATICDPKEDEASQKYSDRMEALENEITDLDCILADGEDEEGNTLTEKQQKALKKSWRPFRNA